MRLPKAAWYVTPVSVAGTSHIAKGIQCQDASHYAIQDDFCFIAVADGVGSASRAEEGANTAVNAAIQFLVKNANDTMGEAEWRECMRKAGEHALHAVRKLAEREGETLNVFASTLLLVAATKDIVVAFHVGDGAIVARFDDSELLALTLPKKGEFANEVMPLTSKNAIKEAQITFCARAPAALAVFTDGLESLALALARGEPSKKFFEPIFDLGSRVNEVELAREIHELFEHRIKKRSDDDLTLVVAIRTATAKVPSTRLVPNTSSQTEMEDRPERPIQRNPVSDVPSGDKSQQATHNPTLTRAGEVKSPRSLVPRAGKAVLSIGAFFAMFTFGLFVARNWVRTWVCSDKCEGSQAPSAALAINVPSCTSLPPQLPQGAGVLGGCGQGRKCEAWLSCVNGRCIQKGRPGETCQSTDECEQGLQCFETHTLRGKTDSRCGMKMPQQKGIIPCESDDKCGRSEPFCVKGYCRLNRLGAGRICDKDDDCAEPLRCYEAHCRAELLE